MNDGTTIPVAVHANGVHPNGVHAPTEASAPAAGQPQSPTASRPSSTPPIDIHDGPEGLDLIADLPGVTAEAVTIHLEDNVLSLHARSHVVLPEGAKALHEEFPFGEYSRSFILSDEVDRTRIEAELKDGVLRLHLPKTQRSQTRRIEVKGQ